MEIRAIPAEALPTAAHHLVWLARSVAGAFEGGVEDRAHLPELSVTRPGGGRAREICGNQAERYRSTLGIAETVLEVRGSTRGGGDLATVETVQERPRVPEAGAL